LHVVDVVEQLDARGIDFVHNARAPRGVVGHVVGMVDLAVEQLEADGDAVIFGNFLQTIEAGDGVARAVVVGHAATISGERDDVGDTGFRSERDIFPECGLDGGVILDAIESVRDGASAGVAHGADQTVAARDIVLRDLEQVDSVESELRGPPAKLFQWRVFVAPSADGLADGFAGLGLQWLCRQIESGCEGGGCSGFEERSAR
jgi:hypothetical protein